LLPHELAARHVAPYMRALVAQALSGKGLGQERIARLLGVTQAMVNKYLSWSEGYVWRRLAEAGVPRDEAESLVRAAAEKLARGDQAGYMELLTAFMNRLLSSGALCSLHQRHGAPEHCSICTRLFSASTDTVIEEVRRAVELVAASAPPVAVPNVGSNVVYARPGAESVEDVAGLTGALIRLSDGRVVPVGEPAYGGSRHTAQVLLLVARRWPRLRSAIVAAYHEAIIDCLRGSGYVLEVGPHCCPEGLLHDIREAVEASSEAPVAIASRGGYNLEPVVYIFGEKPLDVARLLLWCSRNVRTG